jgi:hypothetical protein
MSPAWISQTKPYVFQRLVMVGLFPIAVGRLLMRLNYLQQLFVGILASHPVASSSLTDAPPPLGVHTTRSRIGPVNASGVLPLRIVPRPANAWMHDQVIPPDP